METLDLGSIDFKIKVTLPSGTPLEINPVAQLIIDENNVRKEIRELPAQYALFSSCYIKYKKNRDLIEFKIKELKNAHSKTIREQNKDINNKRVEELVESIDEIKEMEKNLIAAEYYVSQLYYLVEGLEKKQKSLNALDYMNAREEKAGNNYSKVKAFNEEIQIDPNRFNKK